MTERGEWHQLGFPHSDSAAFPGSAGSAAAEKGRFLLDRCSRSKNPSPRRVWAAYERSCCAFSSVRSLFECRFTHLHTPTRSAAGHNCSTWSAQLRHFGECSGGLKGVEAAHRRQSEVWAVLVPVLRTSANRAAHKIYTSKLYGGLRVAGIGTPIGGIGAQVFACSASAACCCCRVNSAKGLDVTDTIPSQVLQLLASALLMGFPRMGPRHCQVH